MASKVVTWVVGVCQLPSCLYRNSFPLQQPVGAVRKPLPPGGTAPARMLAARNDNIGYAVQRSAAHTTSDHHRRRYRRAVAGAHCAGSNHVLQQPVCNTTCCGLYSAKTGLVYECVSIVARMLHTPARPGFKPRLSKGAVAALPTLQEYSLGVQATPSNPSHRPSAPLGTAMGLPWTLGLSNALTLQVMGAKHAHHAAYKPGKALCSAANHWRQLSCFADLQQLLCLHAPRCMLHASDVAQQNSRTSMHLLQRWYGNCAQPLLRRTTFAGSPGCYDDCLANPCTSKHAHARTNCSC